MEKSGINRRDFFKRAALFVSSIAFPSLIAANCRDSDDLAKTTAPAFLTKVNPKVDVLLKNASVIDVHTGRLLKENMILIKDGRILDIIGDNGTGIHADKTYDLNGEYVIPGLINAHTHISMPCTVSFTDINVLKDLDLLSQVQEQGRRNATECVKHGVTTVRDVGAMFNMCENLKKEIVKGDIMGPRIINSCVMDISYSFMSLAFGTLVDPSLCYFRYADKTDQAIHGVCDVKKAGMNWIKLYHQVKNMATPLPQFQIMDDAMAKLICGEARLKNIPVAIHITDAAGLRKGLDAGVTSLEHIIIDREFTRDEIHEIIDKDICFVPTSTISIGLCYETKNDPDWSKGIKKWIVEERNRLLPSMIYEYLLPDIAKVQFDTFVNYSDPDYFDLNSRWNELLMLDPDAFIGIMTNGMANVMAIYDAGIKIGCGNDGGMPFIFPGAVGLEMHLLKKIGYAPDDILKMATINNAEILRLDKDLGSTEKGKIADLAVFRNNPLDSFENTFKASKVFQNGVLVHSA